ncbi:MAG: putative glycolipid-binding domain-containing protein [Roseovarius sp.]
MTGQTIATVHWHALDRMGEDHCRLARLDKGWLLVGHARFRDGDGHAALDYVVRSDADWNTLSADVTGQHDGRDVLVSISRNDGAWVMNTHDQPQVAGARDIDLAFTPATNLMPLRRLANARHSTQDNQAAWLRYPDCELQRLDQSYTRHGTSDLVSYAARQTGYQTQLRTDPSGFVTLYPEAWRGEVTHVAA